VASTTAQPPVAVAAEPFDSPDAARLLGLAMAELQARYGPGPHDVHHDVGEDPDRTDKRHSPLTAEEFGPPGGTFLVARVGGRAVGCVGLRQLDPGVAEVKRLFVEPELRRQGVARVLMDELEHAAPLLGYHHLVLETGGLQPEAVALYRSSGWTPISSYMGPPRHEHSVYFEKRLEER